MTLYNSMAPSEEAPEMETKISGKARLQIPTAETATVKALDPCFDWNHWDGPSSQIQSWQRSDIEFCRNIKPDSPQSLSSSDHRSPASEELSRQSKCPKCGLTRKQYEIVKTYICGHLCPDLLHDEICPDISAAHLSRNGCPIRDPKGKTPNRRRSSLSKPPMLALDESTYEDVDESKETNRIVLSPDQDNPDEEHKSTMRDLQNQISEDPGDHIIDSSNGEFAAQKYSRVGNPLKLMRLGEGRAAEHTALEHTHRLSINERDALRETRDVGITTTHHYDDLRPAMAVAEPEAENHITDKLQHQITTAESKENHEQLLRAAEAGSAGHLDDCAICSDDEGLDDEFHEAMHVVKPSTKPRRYVLDDEYNSCAGGPDAHINSRDFAQEQVLQHLFDRSMVC